MYPILIRVVLLMEGPVGFSFSLDVRGPSALSGFCAKSKVLIKLDFEIGLLLLGAYAMDEILIVL